MWNINKLGKFDLEWGKNAAKDGGKFEAAHPLGSTGIKAWRHEQVL